MNERIKVAAKLKKLEDERAKLLSSVGATGGPKTVDARNAWIRAVNALVANAALAELPADVDTLVFSALRLTSEGRPAR